ncbi:aminotransferase class V-fold PLP-dependent enzyme [Arenicella xantha]|uniref:Kynureninase n=1 Tax=Arenicella xantha TaxID=644221 RepID=A0A395JP92_9GAMM|nr:aminotransferase class V-fold PLP-dependent enzyme [Arenicella xantha]RBP53429.1 kynureninase [Arenicella xantha]
MASSTNHAGLFTPSNGIYLLAHSIGKMPITTVEHCQTQFFAPWQSGQEDIWPQWLTQIERFKQALANLFNASADEFCPQSNVSSGLNKVITSLPTKPGRNTIVMNANDFPSAGFVLQQAEHLGYKVKVIDKHANPLDLETWRNAITDDVHSVFITHVHYNTNTQVDVEAISQLARSRGALSIVDVAQSAGIVPIDLAQWHADIVVGSCIKWLCGGPGAGYLWVDQNLITQLKPHDLGWFSHKDPFEFDINHFEYADNSNRFWGGTPSVMPYIAATHSIELLTKIGIETIRQHNVVLRQLLIDQLPSEQLVSPSNPQHCGGTLVIKPNQQSSFVSNMQKADILFDEREHGVRLSPHIYTNREDIEQVLNCLS